MNKLYRQSELTDDESDTYVFPHVDAMTGEKLHSKAEIAFELGVRDKRIAELDQEREQRDLEMQAKALQDLADDMWELSPSRIIATETQVRARAKQLLKQEKGGDV